MKRIIIFAFSFLCMIGCSTTQYYEFKVVSQSAISEFPNNNFCKVLYLNKDEKTIDGRYYVSQTEQLLKDKGIVINGDADESTNCLITVKHSTDYGKEQQVGYTWGQTGISGATSSTNAYMSSHNLGSTTYASGYATTRTTYTPTYGITGTYTYDVSKSYISFGMLARDANSDEEMWKILMLHPGHVNNKFVEVFPLFKCIASHYLFQNFDSILRLSRDELDQIFQGHCNLIQWPNEPTLAAVTREAKKGNSDSQFYLGQMYFFGQGVEKDNEQALYWLTQAAEQGNVESQKALVLLYSQGQEVPADYSKALYWSTKAAEQGDAVAQRYLGYVYYRGQGTNKDFAAAFDWFSKAAEQGDVDAQLWLADMYYKGEGGKQNMKEAFAIYARPLVRGNILAEARLSCYDANIQTLQQHFERCLTMAKVGDARAQYAVFSAYYNGLGTKKDPQEAHAWLIKAAKQESKYAEVQKEIELRMSNEM